MRLIDADALLRKYEPIVFTAQTDFAEGMRDVIENIKNAPIIDAVPVVRCKDCRNGCRIDGHEDRVWCNHWDFDSDKNDFCSYGERKEETD